MEGPSYPVKWIFANCAAVNPVALLPKNILPPVPADPPAPVQPLIVSVLADQVARRLSANFKECGFEPKSMVEFELNANVDVLTQLTFDAIFAVLKHPPFRNILEANVEETEFGMIHN